MKIAFWKYQGTGNDFIMLDGRSTDFKDLSSEKIQYLCHRRFGIGADGLIILENSADHDFIMRYYNSDGNISSMCGNGGRCITRFAHDLGIIRERYQFMAIDGLHEAYLQDGRVFLKMSDVSEVRNADANDYFVDTGSPHYVRFEERVPEGDIRAAARAIRNSDPYRDEGVNVNFVMFENGKLRMRTYERGVEDETLSCGTGVTAAALAAAHAGMINDNSVAVSTPGGDLELRYRAVNHGYHDIWLIGPCRICIQR